MDGSKSKLAVWATAGIAVVSLLALWWFRTPAGEESDSRRKLPGSGAMVPGNGPTQQGSASNPGSVSPELPDAPKALPDPVALAKSLLPRHKAGLTHFGHRKMEESRFVSEEHLLYREARLLALAFPQAILSFASKEARDPANDEDIRSYCSYMLYILAKQRNSSAMEVLEALAQDSDATIAEVALSGLGAADTEGRFRGYYLEKCRSNVASAYLLVDRWIDQATQTEMKKQLSGANKIYAEEVLRRQGVLADSRCEEKLEAILRGKETDGIEDAPVWAIDMLLSRNPARFQEAARSELDRTFTKAAEFWAANNTRKPFAEAYANDAELALGLAIWPTEYDDLLVAMAESGGKLTEPEKRRLRTFGYACDPKERLSELLQGK